MQLLRLDHIQLGVRNLQATLAFYRDVLGFRVTWSGAWARDGDWVHAGRRLRALFADYERSALGQEIDRISSKNIRNDA
jgi:catechol 2,3-dioxygenase-like lactoylglutathione lyase family enzyme